MSAFSGTGLSCTATDAAAIGGGFRATITDRLAAYRHEIQAVGGYWTASLQIKAGVPELNDWLQSGLGRDITAYDEAGVVVWNGFVDKMTFNFGPVSAVRGPLSEIANRVDLAYSTVDTSTTPPTVGVRRRVGNANDTTSQGRWGIWVKVLSTGGATAANAEQLRDSYLAERAEPFTTLSQGGNSEPSVTLDCLGYVHLLKAYPYNSATTGTTTASAKLQALLAADPSARFSTNYTQISTNALTVKAYENDDNLAWDLAKGIVALGDASDNRWNLGVYAGRQMYYAVAPTTIAYYQQLYSPGRQIFDVNGGRVPPWRVLPGNWLFFPDFLIGLVPEGGALRDDPRAAYLESVTYTAPYDFAWTGTRLSAIDQRLAQLGLSGVGG